MTVLAGYNADGEMLPTMVVYPLRKPRKEIVSGVPDGWVIGLSDSGWMKAETFFEYVANNLSPWLDEKNIPKPVLFVVDGHKTHMTYPLSKFCSETWIILYALLPNATHILQPMDVSVFQPLKVEWKKTFRKWQANHHNQCVTRKEFATLLKMAMENGVTLETIQNGFRTCGFYPFDPNAVQYDKCVKDINQKQSHVPLEKGRLDHHQDSIASKLIDEILESKHAGLLRNLKTF